MSVNQAYTLRLLCRNNLPKPRALGRPLINRVYSTGTRQWSTPLAKSLAEAITTTGPVSIAKFMRQCLTSDLGGYYTNQPTENGDQFGKRGDFITSPEISQIFGELVGIWFVAEWMAQGKKSSGVQLVELGPGRGTLIEDALRTLANFRPMASAVDAVYLVESSPALREAQRKRLCGDSPMEEHPDGFQSRSIKLPGTKVVWVEDVKFIPREANKTPFIIAHEFFDALPIHAFQSVAASKHTQSQAMPNTRVADPAPTAVSSPAAHSTSPARNQWRELLVSPTAPPSVINPPKEPGPEFELTISSTPTRHSQLLPNISSRYQGLLSTTGSTIEISPETRTITTALVDLITGTLHSKSHQERLKSTPSGAALIIDYGPSSTIPISSLRGIRQHERISPLASPGLVDISADVDFGAVVEAALESSAEVEVHGPAEQGDWLGAMGGKERSEMLLGKADDDETKERLKTGWQRLVEKGPNGMGRLYKVLAIVPESGGRRRPVGFGGDVDAEA